MIVEFPGGGIPGWGAGAGNALVPDVAGTAFGLAGSEVGPIIGNSTLDLRKGYVYGEPHFFDSTISSQLGVGFIAGGVGALYQGGNAIATWDTNSGFRVGPGGLQFSPTHAANASDVKIYRDGAGILAQRNGTNPQEWRLHNTYTDGSNYERLSIAWDTNVAIIGTEAAGTGSQRRTQLGEGNNGFVAVNDYGDSDGVLFGQGGATKMIMRPTALRPSAAGGMDLGESGAPWRNLYLRPSSSLTPSSNGDVTLEATNDTTLTFKFKGSDGTVRSGTVALL